MKKIILVLITIGLFWGLTPPVNSFANSDSFTEKSEIFDASSDSHENCELENSKFFNQESSNFELFKISLLLENKNEIALSENFSAVPTSPPNC